MDDRELIDALTTGVTIFDLGRPLVNGMPQSGDHPPFRMTVSRRHGDIVRADGSTGANDILFFGGHVGTHIDALSHISYRGMLHGGVRVEDAMEGGRFIRHGAEEIPILVRRGVLLDIAAARGVEHIDGDSEVTVADLEAALAAAGGEIRDGDVVLIRTGWGGVFDDRELFEGERTGMPGLGAAGAEWLARHRPVAIGGDTIAVEHIGPSSGPGRPVHKILIVDEGIHLIETMNLEELAAAGASEFVFVLSPLAVVGATGAPARPIALVRTPAA
jgi:kynurenine formamidase